MSTPVVAPWTVKRLLEVTVPFFARKNVDSPRLSAERLLAHTLGVSRIELYTRTYEVPLSEEKLAAFRDLVKRASEEEPIDYLIGSAPFFNLDFEVNADVLIPRPDTETIVEHVLQLCRLTPGFEEPRVLDLCTGSGCVAAGIAHHHKHARVLATDISAAAVAVAKRNIAKLGLADRVTVEVGDLFEPIARAVDAQPFNLIVSNPPYIPTALVAELDRSVRDYEPTIALDGGDDGLTIHRRILAAAKNHLAPGGRIYLEIMFDQGERALSLAREHAYLADAKIVKDASQRDRVLTARNAVL